MNKFLFRKTDPVVIPVYLLSIYTIIILFNRQMSVAIQKVFSDRKQQEIEDDGRLRKKRLRLREGRRQVEIRLREELTMCQLLCGSDNPTRLSPLRNRDKPVVSSAKHKFRNRDVQQWGKSTFTVQYLFGAAHSVNCSRNNTSGVAGSFSARVKTFNPGGFKAVSPYNAYRGRTACFCSCQ